MNRWANKEKIKAYYKTMKVFFDLACMLTCFWGLPKPKYELFITHNRGTLRNIYYYQCWKQLCCLHIVRVFLFSLLINLMLPCWIEVFIYFKTFEQHGSSSVVKLCLIEFRGSELVPNTTEKLLHKLKLNGISLTLHLQECWWLKVGVRRRKDSERQTEQCWGVFTGLSIC